MPQHCTVTSGNVTISSMAVSAIWNSMSSWHKLHKAQLSAIILVRLISHQNCTSIVLLLVNHMLEVQVADKNFQPHKWCAIASSTFLLVCFVSVKCRRGLSIAIYFMLLLTSHVSN